MELQDQDLARKDLLEFICEMNDDYIVNWHHEEICDRLSRLPDEKKQRLMIFVPPQTGKPIFVDEMVTMGDGSLRRLGDIITGDQVIDKDGLIRDVIDAHDQGDLETIEIETFSGRTIRAAKDHPFLTTTGWVNAGDLNPHDYLCIRSKVESLGLSDRSWQEFRFLGYLIGDGYVGRANRKYNGESYHCKITQADERTWDDIKSLADDLGFGYSVYKKKDSLASDMSFKGSVREWLNSTGIAGKTSHDKSIPDWIFSGSDEQIAHFIAGYWMSDGTISSKGKNRSGSMRRDGTIELYSVSRHLLSQVQNLLSRLSIQSKIRAKHIRSRDYISWRLTVGDSHNASIFKKKIPMVSYKMDRLNELSISTERSDDGYLYDEIVSITPSGLLPCKCLTVDQGKSFLASGFVVHNSEIVSRYLPTWLHGRNPNLKIIVASYSGDLAIGFNRDSQRIIDSETYGEIFPGTTISSKSTSSIKGKWKRTANTYEVVGTKGYLYSVGVGGSTTGKGADVFIVDDPFKDLEQAYSPTIREKVLNWYKAVANTRLSKDAHVIIMHTRWHREDLAGSLLKAGKKSKTATQWEVLNFPAMSKEIRDPKDHRKDQDIPLWPEFKGSAASMMQIKEDVGPVIWNALYQQDPREEGGNIVKESDLRFWSIAKKDDLPVGAMAQSWDLPFKDKKTSSMVVGQVWLRGHDKNYYLLDQIRGHWDFNRCIVEMQNFYNKWPVPEVLVEDKANGPAIMAVLSDQIKGFKAITPRADKETRFIACSPAFAGNKVYIPDVSDAPWALDYISEITDFPNSDFDDQVDCTSQILNHWYDPVSSNIIPLSISKISNWR